MRILLILVVVGALCFFGFQSFQRIAFGKTTDPPASVPLPPSPAPVTPPVALPAVPAVLAPSSPSVPPPVVGTAHRFYVFENRDVPSPPFNRSETSGGRADERGVQLSVDSRANAWVIRGPILEVEQMLSIAKGLDLKQDQLDLDFLLVALSEDYVRSWGLDAFFKDGASYLSAFSLEPTGLSLTLAHGSGSVVLSAEASNGGARIVSSPVVRIVTGEPWEFSADTQVPIATLQRSEGVVSTAYNYRKVGLGLSGVLTRAPNGRYRAKIDQRNGTVDAVSKDSGVPPQLREQLLKTSAVLELNRWTIVGGVRSWRSEESKGFLGKSEKETQELLLVFTRPRSRIDAIPRAIPVNGSPDSVLRRLAPYGPDPLGQDGSPLLPPKDWKRRLFPDGVETHGLPLRTVGPRSK